MTSRFRKGDKSCWVESNEDLRPSSLLDINIKVLYEDKGVRIKHWNDDSQRSRGMRAKGQVQH